MISSESPSLATLTSSSPSSKFITISPEARMLVSSPSFRALISPILVARIIMALSRAFLTGSMACTCSLRAMGIRLTSRVPRLTREVSPGIWKARRG